MHFGKRLCKRDVTTRLKNYKNYFIVAFAVAKNVRVVCYFPYYSQDFDLVPDKVDTKLCTHIVYAYNVIDKVGLPRAFNKMRFLAKLKFWSPKLFFCFQILFNF